MLLDVRDIAQGNHAAPSKMGNVRPCTGDNLRINVPAHNVNAHGQGLHHYCAYPAAGIYRSHACWMRNRHVDRRPRNTRAQGNRVAARFFHLPEPGCLILMILSEVPAAAQSHNAVHPLRMVHIRFSLNTHPDLTLNGSAFIILNFFFRGQIVRLHKNHLECLPLHLYLFSLLVDILQTVPGVHNVNPLLDKRTAADIHLDPAPKDRSRNFPAKQTAQLHSAQGFFVPGTGVGINI
ncbi:hypothetical protein D3C74_346240 [compost metagenome]